MKPAAVLGCLALVLASCSASAPTTSIDVRVEVPIGETVTVAGGEVGVRLDAVPQDSRCPGDAMCVSPGHAVADVTLLVDDRETTVSLRTDASGPTVVARGVALQLVRLDPYPFFGRPTQPGDYRATLRIVR